MDVRRPSTTPAPSPPAPPAPPADLLVTREPVLRRCWHAVAFAAALGTEPVARRLLGSDLVLWRGADGRPRAALDRCPHRWARLSAGRGDAEGGLTCPYHGWRFGDDGRATRIPHLPEGAALPPAACLDLLPCTEHLGLAWASLEPGPVNALPVVPEVDDPAYRRIEVGTFANACSAAAVVDNNTDTTHVPFVHAATFGAGQGPEVPLGHVERTGFGLRLTADAMGIANRPGDAAPSSRTSATEVWLPFVQVSRLGYPDGGVHILVKACCPVDDDRTEVHLAVLRNDAEAPADAEAVRRFEAAIEAEDAAVLATLPAAFPLDVRAQCHTAHDRGGLAYRHALADLLRA